MGEGMCVISRSNAQGLSAWKLPGRSWERLLLDRADGDISASRLARGTARRHERVHGASAASSHRDERRFVTWTTAVFAPRRMINRSGVRRRKGRQFTAGYLLTDISPWPGQAVGQTLGGVAR